MNTYMNTYMAHMFPQFKIKGIKKQEKSTFLYL